MVRVDSGDAIDEKVGVRQVEARIESQGHHRRGGIYERSAAHHAENGVVGIGPQRMDTCGKVDHLVQMLALDPELEFPGRVAGVGANFKGRDDDRADGPRFLLRAGHGGEKQRDGEDTWGEEFRWQAASPGIVLRIPYQRRLCTPIDWIGRLRVWIGMSEVSCEVALWEVENTAEKL